LVAVSIVWIPIIQHISELFHYIQAITSFLAPPVCAVYVLAVFWKRTNEKVYNNIIKSLYYEMITLNWLTLSSGTRGLRGHYRIVELPIQSLPINTKVVSSWRGVLDSILCDNVSLYPSNNKLFGATCMCSLCSSCILEENKWKGI
jgi:hypothetical protein